MAQKKASTQSIDLLDLEDRIHRLLSDDLEAEMEAGDLEGVPERDALIVRTRRVLEGESLILTKDQTEQLIRGVVDRIVGLGPLEPLWSTMSRMSSSNAREGSSGWMWLFAMMLICGM